MAKIASAVRSSGFFVYGCLEQAVILQVKNGADSSAAAQIWLKSLENGIVMVTVFPGDFFKESEV